MGYKCSYCGKHVGPCKPMIKHTIYRTKTEQFGENARTTKEIAAERPSCEECAPKAETQNRGTQNL